MPYRMTPSVRHRAIEVYYYYYYLLSKLLFFGYCDIVYLKNINYYFFVI